MSLALRLSLVVLLVLAAAGLAVGISLHERVKAQHSARLRAATTLRLAWIRSGLEYNGHELEFDPGAEPAGAATLWWIQTQDGRELWAAPPASDKRAPLWSDARALVLGSGPLAAGATFAANPPPLRHRNRPYARRYERNEAGPPRAVALSIRAATDASVMHAELARLRQALLVVGPLALGLAALLLVTLIRTQLRPLGQVIAQAERIGPASPAPHIAYAGQCRELVRLREALNRMLERIEDGRERERLFSAAAAHELRTPLAQLRLELEVLLRRERSADEYRRSLAEALEDVAQLEQLSQSLLQLARLERLPQTCEGAVDLRHLLEAAREEWPESCIEISVAQDSPSNVRGDETLLRLALRNLLANAHQYAPESPVTLCAQAGDNGWLDVLVTDRGPGIPPEDREQIFRPLRRLHPGGRAGTGLGLSLARAAVRACGGDIRCEPRPDGQPGACFRLQLVRA